jgi:hypothetical protein
MNPLKMTWELFASAVFLLFFCNKTNGKCWSLDRSERQELSGFSHCILIFYIMNYEIEE